jgi:hypothetical protein
MVTMLQSTNKVETFSGMRAVMKAPFGVVTFTDGC